MPKIRYLDRTKSAGEDYDRQSGSDSGHFPSSVSKTVPEPEAGGGGGAQEKEGRGSKEEQRVSQLGKTTSVSTSSSSSSSVRVGSSSSTAPSMTSTTATTAIEPSSLKSESPPFVGSVNYGEAPSDPPLDSNDAIKVSVKFPWGK